MHLCEPGRQPKINKSNDQIPDPAKPEIQDEKDDTFKLDVSDAQFVDVIHTNGGVLGIMESVSCSKINFDPLGNDWTEKNETFLNGRSFGTISCRTNLKGSAGS